MIMKFNSDLSNQTMIVASNPNLLSNMLEKFNKDEPIVHNKENLLTFWFVVR